MKFSYTWHRRLGLVLAPLLAIQALCGLALLWMQPLPTLQNSPQVTQAWASAVDQGLVALALKYPEAKVEYVNLPSDAQTPVSVRLLASSSNVSGWADIDVKHGTIGALQPDNSQTRTLLYGLHDHLLMNDAGPWVLRAIALISVALLVMGLRAWLRLRRLPAGTPWVRAHRWIAPIAALPILIILVTGFVLRSPEWTRSALSVWQSPAAAAPSAPPIGSGSPTVTLGQALAAASAALPEARPLRIYPPRNGEVRVRMRGDEWHPLGLNNVFVNSANISAPRIVRADQQPLTVRYLNIVYSLHLGATPGGLGWVGALAARMLWTVLALALAGLALTGVMQRVQRKEE